jgi:hypothetical protein
MWRKYFMYAQIFWIGANVMGANISRAQAFHGREHFMGANISWAQTFHGREHFMGANISWVRIFHGREYSWARIFMGANILRCAHIFLIGSKYFVCKLLF